VHYKTHRLPADALSNEHESIFLPGLPPLKAHTSLVMRSFVLPNPHTFHRIDKAEDKRPGHTHKDN
jgi:hypothetical protein